MSLVDHLSREIHCKVVYYGPSMSGKTRNLQYISNRTSPDIKGQLISMSGENERTLFFDFLPLSFGEIRGYRTKFHLYTVPGQAHFAAPRKLILRGVDGVVFVADSQIERMEANVAALENMRSSLGELGYDLDVLPLVMQFNKRDLDSIAPVDELRRLLNPNGVPDFEATATTGQGVFGTLKAIAKLVLARLSQDEKVLPET